MASHTRRFPVSSDKRFRKLPGGGDHGTPERWQHSGRALELTERAGVLAVRVTEEHIIDVLAMRRLLDEVQVQAGFKRHTSGPGQPAGEKSHFMPAPHGVQGRSR